MSFDGEHEPQAFTSVYLESITNNFSDEYLIAETSIGKVYKVPYSSPFEEEEEEDDKEEDRFDLLIRRSTTEPQYRELMNDIGLSMNIRHRNIVPIFGYFLDDDEKHEVILVTKYEVNGSLDKHLSDPTTLTWIQRLRICLGVAQVMSYLHYDLSGHARVIHGNIQSCGILFDDKWEPKLFGFEYSIICHRSQQLSLTSKYGGTRQYMDPTYEKTGGLTLKSDVFSFGVVLFEVLFGRKASIVNEDKWYFAKLAKRHYEAKILDDMIDPVLRQQMDTQSLDIFAKTAYYCLNEQRAQRLNTHEVVSRLVEALDHQMVYENPELATIEDESTVFIHPKGKNLEHLKIRLTDILSATKNFSERYFLGSGGFAKVYRAELDHFDSSQSWSVAEKARGEFPKRCSIVAIKHILGIKGKQGFFAEIEMLTSCKHQNIVSLLGFCDEDSHMILVYEYVSNGSLDDYLENSSKMTNFTWARRIRICLNIANGLKYLHSNTEDKQMIVHRDIKSANILLNNNFEAKIADFGLSKLRPMSQKGSTLNTNVIAGTYVYLDPEYRKSGKLKKQSDIYSFGVVLFEIMCGKVAYDKTYLVQNEKGLSFVARRYWSEGRIKEIVDPNLQEAYENIFMINKGLSQDSLDTFSRIAVQCLAETQSERPTMEVIINELEKALSFEENHKDNLQISVEEIILATQNFSPTNCVGSGRHWKAYKGEVLHANGRHTSIVAKRWESMSSDHQFLTELDVLFKCKHENIIGLSGYCKEKVIVYEHACNGSLDNHLDDPSLTWTKRLKICIDVARGLKCLHDETQPMILVHRGIKSANILLDGDWKAKISNFHLSSSVTSFNTDIENIINDANDSLGYLDPNYKDSFLAEEMDIYSLGVVLFEILCGRLAWVEGCEDQSQSLGPLAKSLYEEGRFDEIVFKGIKDQIVPKSLTTFQRVAYECLRSDDSRRPVANGVMVQLEKALEFQEDYEIWGAKLPKDYKEIFCMSKTSEISTKSNKDLYDMLNKGILLQQEKVLFSLGSNGERNEMISAKKFIYKKRWVRKWRSLSVDSRFPKVAEVLDISNLMIEIKIKTQFLTPGVNYKVNLIFRFWGPRKTKLFHKPMYVDFKYNMGGKNLHAYFATWRDDGWMILELCRFLCYKEDTNFEVLLESFSRCYSGSRTIYVEGIEFQAIDNVIIDKDEKVEEVQAIDNVMKDEDIEHIEVKHVEIGMLKKVQQFLKSNSKREKLKSMLSEMNRKKHDIPSEVKDHITRKVKEKKDHLVSKVSTKKDRLLSRVHRKKDRLISGVNEVKDQLDFAKAVMYGSLSDELNLTPSAQSSTSKFETGSDETLKIFENHDEREELLSASNVNTNEHHMLSAKDFLYDTYNVKLLQLKPSVQSRYQELVELRTQQVLHIKCRIKFQMSPNTEYACYLVFKLSERCCGLHSPVIVRDLLHWKRDTGILYFRSPSPWNIHDTNWIPEKRKDGWMEVNVWKFNSDFELRYGSVPMNLKLVTYEGTMSGLIICGLEIRPI